MTTPVRLTQTEVAKFPRFGLFAILVAYALPGLFGRDPWRTDDAVGFGVMWTMARGSLGDWLMPNVVGAQFLDDGPLFYALGAVLMRVFGGIVPVDELSRVLSLVAIGGAAAAIWYGTYLLGRRAEAQPQQFAFGGHPDPRDYGRVLADGALLIGIAVLGLLMRAHEASAEIAQYALACVLLFALVRTHDKPWQGAVTFGLATGALALTRHPAALLFPLVAAVTAFVLSRPLRAQAWRFWPLAIATAVVPLVGWWIALDRVPGGPAYRDAWLAAHALEAWIARPATWGYYLRNLPWFVWPAWPLALLALWTWRTRADAPHVAIPLAGFAGAFAYLAFGQQPGDTAMLMAVPPAVFLAAFGLPALRRDLANLIDWFALLVFSVFALTIWFCWFATMTGWPPRIANNFAKLAPGYEFVFSPPGFLLAVFVTAGWVWVVRWRIVARPNVLWRSTVLSSSGLALIWMLLVALALPYADYLKTYRTVATDIARHLPAEACVQDDRLGLSQRASLAYLGDVRFGGAECAFVLRYRDARETLPRLDPEQWALVWEGRRAADRNERLVLYRRRASAGA